MSRRFIFQILSDIENKMVINKHAHETPCMYLGNLQTNLAY